MILAYGQPRLSETGRPLITVDLRLRHRETPQAQARGHAEERGGDEDPAVADPIEKLTGGERQPEDQAEEWAGQTREDREQERRRDIDPEGATNLRAEPRSDHLRLSGLTGAAGPDPWSSRSSPATIMSRLAAPASLPGDVV